MELQYKRRKLVTVITEAAIEDKVVQAIHEAGAKGYTACDAWGEGSRGIRAGEWDASRNVRIETVCGEDVAHALVEFLFKTYYSDYAMIVFLADVEVTRPEKF